MFVRDCQVRLPDLPCIGGGRNEDDILRIRQYPAEHFKTSAYTVHHSDVIRAHWCSL